MIPTLLVVGLVLGGLIHHRKSFVWASTVLVTMAVVWGVGVGIADGTMSALVGGAGLAFVNLTAGASVSALIRNARRWCAGKNTETTRSPRVG